MGARHLWLGLAWVACAACTDVAGVDIGKPSITTTAGEGCPDGTEGCSCIDGQCLPGLTCASGLCVDVDGTSTGGGSGTTTVGATGPGSTGSGGSTGGGSTGPNTTGPMVVGELERCDAGQQCDVPLQCRPILVGGEQRCTRTCQSNAQCPSGLRCIDSGAGSFCLRSDIGRPCQGAAACNFGCLELTPGYCTDACVTGSDCPVGYGCQEVGAPPQRVCVKVEALCDSGNTGACVGPAACDLSPNLILGSCTIACSSAADCPQRAAPFAPWTCDGLCRRPGDVYGPLPGGFTPTEWHCDPAQNPAVLCHDAQHIDFTAFTVPPPPVVDCQSMFTTPGLPGDACVDSCRYSGGCAHGFACTALGNIAGQRIGLCLPRGAAEPGTPCTANVECLYGYCAPSGVCSRDCTLDGVCPGGTTCVAGGGPTVEGMPFRRCE